MITNNWLVHSLLNKEGFMALRQGNVESTALLQTDGIYKQMYSNAGFYGDDETYKKWKNLYLRALINMDCNLEVVSCPSFVVCGDVLTKFNIWAPSLAYIEKIDFWINLLDIFKKFDKKICIVSYFAQEMKEQYTNIKKIFPHVDLSGIQIEWVSSWNTIEGNTPHKDFIDTFEKLKDKIDKTNSDVYLVSCGCYGLPLCHHIKTKNKNSIYVGGLLQILFGLKGTRWRRRKEINKYYNKFWKYPQKKPNNSEGVEGWCYGGDEAMDTETQSPVSTP